MVERFLKVTFVEKKLTAIVKVGRVVYSGRDGRRGRRGRKGIEGGGGGGGEGGWRRGGGGREGGEAGRVKRVAIDSVVVLRMGKWQLRCVNT